MTITVDAETRRLCQILADRYGTHSGVFLIGERMFLEPICKKRKYVWRTLIKTLPTAQPAIP